MTDTTTISLQNLTIGYKNRKGTFPIVRDINQKLERGSVTGLVGPNGGGKSTLLRTIAGFLPPLSGHVMIQGENIDALPSLVRSRLIAVVLTHSVSVENMNVYQLVALGRTPYTGFFGHLENIDRQHIEHALELTGINNLSQRRISSLSDGELQKALIAKALAQDTAVILLDEPTAFLDYPSKIEIMTLLKRMANDENKTVIISTHDLDIAFSIIDNIWIIDKTSGFVSGNVSELINNGTIDNYFPQSDLTYSHSWLKFKQRSN